MRPVAQTAAGCLALLALALASGTGSAQQPNDATTGEGHFRIYLDGKFQTRVAPGEVAKATEKYAKLYKKKTVTSRGPFYSAKAVRASGAATAGFLSTIPGIGANAKQLIDAYIDQNYPAASMAYGDKVSAEFRKRVREVAAALGVTPDDLMTVMALETGGKFLPGVYPSSGAVGLIQFTKVAADELGTTKDALAALSAVDQLAWVQKYLELQAKRHGALADRNDLYLAIFCPAAVGKPGTYVAYDKTKSPNAYNANKSLDANNDGQITRDEITARVRQWTQDPQNVWIDMSKVLGQ